MRITVNGREVHIPDGRAVSIVNGKVIVDGVAWEEQREEDGRIMRVEIKGDLPGGLYCEDSVTVVGHVMGDVTAKGSVTCGTVVEGFVKAGGSVKCGDAMTVDAGGSVQCRDVGYVRCNGSVQANTLVGNLKRKG